jgi:hypothetical protein
MLCYKSQRCRLVFDAVGSLFGYMDGATKSQLPFPSAKASLDEAITGVIILALRSYGKAVVLFCFVEDCICSEDHCDEENSVTEEVSGQSIEQCLQQVETDLGQMVYYILNV